MGRFQISGLGLGVWNMNNETSTTLVAQGLEEGRKECPVPCNNTCPKQHNLGQEYCSLNILRIQIAQSRQSLHALWGPKYHSWTQELLRLCVCCDSTRSILHGSVTPNGNKQNLQALGFPGCMGLSGLKDFRA